MNRCALNPHRLKVVIAFGFTAVCGLLATFLVWVSPNPMPAANAQLLAAFIAMFSAGGYALLRALNSSPRGPRRRSG
jgi:hypothetical protein